MNPQHSLQLAIETTGRGGSVAVLLNEQILQWTNLDPSLRTAAALAPEIARLLAWCRDKEQPLGFVSVADGPGSFTGLRIGVTTAKMLSYALELPIVSVDSLAAVAAEAFRLDRQARSIKVALKAYRGQVFAGHFTRDHLLPPLPHPTHAWTEHPESVAVMKMPEFRRWLDEREPECRLVGDAELLPADADRRAERSCDAIGVGFLAIRAAYRGMWTDPMKLVPRYLKPSAAEEKANCDPVPQHDESANKPLDR